MKSLQEVTAAAVAIRDEINKNANSALRIGTEFIEIVEWLTYFSNKLTRRRYRAYLTQKSTTDPQVVGLYENTLNAGKVKWERNFAGEYIMRVENEVFSLSLNNIIINATANSGTVNIGAHVRDKKTLVFQSGNPSQLADDIFNCYVDIEIFD